MLLIPLVAASSRWTRLTDPLAWTRFAVQALPSLARWLAAATPLA
jgi:hypothetical protein